MLDISLGSFKYNTKDVIRANSIFVSLPYNKLILNVSLKFNNISEINFYYEQVLQMVKLLKINLNINIIDTYDDALKKIDIISDNNFNDIRISKSIFGKFKKNMFGVGYSVSENNILTKKIDNLMIKIFYNIGDEEWTKNNL